MAPDDPRHGEVNTYKTLRCRCQPCAAAAARYEKRRKWLVHQGLNPTIPATGFNRRVRALMAIGWTHGSIAEALGIAPGNLAQKLRANTTVYRATHVAMCEVYEARCMTPQRGPANDRTARIAAKHGWAPPLAWDDIDDPDEQPSGATLATVTPIRERTWDTADHRACPRCGVVRATHADGLRGDLCRDCRQEVA